MSISSRLKVIITGETADLEKSLAGTTAGLDKVAAATANANKATLEKQAADLKVEATQNRVTKAVQRYGAESLQARVANNQLALAEDAAATAAARAAVALDGAATSATAATDANAKAAVATNASSDAFVKLRSSVGKAIAAYAGYEGVKKSVDTTEQLGEATLQLNHVLGLSVKTSSEWAATAIARGIDNRALAQSFGTMSKQVAAADAGSTKAIATFHQLGVSQQLIASGDTEGILAGIADGFANLLPGPQKNALAMNLFGRQWQNVIKIIGGGSDAMNEQLQLADKYGATLGGKTVADVERLIEAQREQKLAMLGVQVQLGSALLPVITRGSKAIAGLAQDFRGLPAPLRGVTAAAVSLGVAFAVSGPLGAGLTALAIAGVLIATNWRQISPVFDEVKSAVSGFFRTSVDLKSLGQAFTNIGTVITAVLGFTVPKMLAGAKEAVSGALQEIAGFVKVFSGVFTGNFGEAWDGVKNIFTGNAKAIVGSVRAIGTPLFDAARDIGGDLLHGLESIAGDVTSWAYDLGKSLAHHVYEGAKHTAESLPGKILGFLESPVKAAAGAAGGRAGGLVATGMAIGGLIAPAASFADGGMVPVRVSPGEQVIYGNSSWTVPGVRTAADSVYTALPPGAAVMTFDGQAKMAMGASLHEALATQLPHFATGGVVGKVSTFGPPGEPAGTTATGVSSAEAGIALRPGDTWQTGRPLLNKLFQVRIGHHLATLKNIDLGPNQSTGRRIDVTGAGARKLGIDPLNFPTDAIGSASPVGKKGVANTSSTLKLGDRYLDSARTAGFEAGLQGATRVSGDLLGNIIAGSIGSLDRKTGDTIGEAPSKDPPASKNGPIAKMIDAAQRIASRNYDYVYGGGHDKLGVASVSRTGLTPGLNISGKLAGSNVGFDCSGYVSAILGAAGLIKAPMSTDGLKTFGVKGAGRQMAIAVRGTTGMGAHTMIALRPKTTSPWGFYESGSGHGPKKVSGWSGTFPIRRHTQGLGAGGVVGALDPMSSRFVGWGLRSGGTVPSTASLITRTTTPSGEDAGAVTAAFNALAKRLADTNRVAFGQLAQVVAHAVASAEAARKAGDSVLARRFDSVAQTARAEQGVRLASPITRLAATQTRLDFQQTHVDNRLQIAGISQTSAAGIGAEIAAGEAADKTLASKKAGLETALARAKKLHNSDAVKQISESLSELDQNLEGRAAALAELARELPRQQAAERIGKYTTALNFLAPAEQAAAGTTSGVDDHQVASVKLGTLQGEQGAVTDEISKALARGDTASAEELTGQLVQIRDEIKTTNDTLRYSIADGKIAASQSAETQDKVSGALAGLAGDTAGVASSNAQLLSDSQGELEAAKTNYAAAVAAGDTAGIDKYGNEIVGLAGSIEQLTQTMTDAQAKQQALTDLTTELVQNQRRLLSIAESQPDQLIAALTAAANGGIGGSLALKQQTPLYPGSGARY